MLNIARNIYTAWNSGPYKHPLPEAEVIPIGESVNEKNKMKRLTTKYTVITEHENIPLPGFTLFKTGRKNWGSTDQTWLVIDPRGFLVRISNENLEAILYKTGITEGLIQERCVWARDDTQTKMTLVPVSSESYQTAVKNTELIESKVDFKDVQIGDEVLLQNELVGHFAGVASLYCPFDNYSWNKEYSPKAHLRRQIIEVKPGKYHFQTDLKILKVIKKADNPITREESIAKMNAKIATGKAFFTNTTDFTPSAYIRNHIALASATARPKPTISLVEIDLLEAQELYYQANKLSDIGTIILENDHGFKFLIDFPYISSGAAAGTFNVMQIATIEETFITLLDDRNYSNKKAKTFTLDKFKKFYKIVKHVKSETYV